MEAGRLNAYNAAPDATRFSQSIRLCRGKQGRTV
jgi:hypothetical protein